MLSNDLLLSTSQCVCSLQDYVTIYCRDAYLVGSGAKLRRLPTLISLEHAVGTVVYNVVRDLVNSKLNIYKTRVGAGAYQASIVILRWLDSRRLPKLPTTPHHNLHVL